MTQEIYGWHIIHTKTGFPYAFCSRITGDQELTEEDVLDGLDHDEFTLIPLVKAGTYN